MGGGGGESWAMAGKLCDSCKSATATLFCRPDSAFLCVPCDSKVHAANKLASRHARVWMCEVCEQAPASVTCKADAAALCATCDRDIHSANPLARRHERFPVVPFYEPAATAPKYSCGGGGGAGGGGEDRYFLDLESGGGGGGEAEEAEAASWLLPNPTQPPQQPPKVMDSSEPKSTDYMFSVIDPYLDLDLDLMSDQKQHHQHQHQQNNQLNSCADGVVPAVQTKDPPSIVDGVPCFEVVDYSGSRPYLYNFSSQTISPTLSSSSMEVGVVPDHNGMGDVSTATLPSQPLTGLDREARVLRYREKRKNRKFEKTIRYASRKAYAETRPRIKGRFAKRTEVELNGVYNSSSAAAMADSGYGVVPSSF